MFCNIVKLIIVYFNISIITDHTHKRGKGTIKYKISNKFQCSYAHTCASRLRPSYFSGIAPVGRIPNKTNPLLNAAKFIYYRLQFLWREFLLFIKIENFTRNKTVTKTHYIKKFEKFMK